jgi:hypothetical protein
VKFEVWHMGRMSPHDRENYPVMVSLTISLLFILISLMGWWLHASLVPMFDRLATMASLCC